VVAVRVFIVIALFAGSSFSQFTTRNPLDELKDQVAMVLANAGVPFTSEQDRQLALLIEEERQASEDLFGVIMDFSEGPPQAEQRDRALAGIQWMHDQFKKKLPDFLTAQQKAAWETFEARGNAVGARIEGAGTGGARREQVQEIRIVNNPFNVENATAGSRGPASGIERTEVIQRGGVGAFHGNFMAMFQDEKLNARNPFASNKPPYYERTINGNISGPLLQNRLTASFAVNDNRQENVGTVKALTLQGPFALGITRPNVTRSYEGRGIFQATESHALHFGFRYETNSKENQNIGNFVLPERGSNYDGRTYKFDIRHIATLTERTILDTRVTWQKDRTENNPLTNGVAINVLDAFNGGSAQDHEEADSRTYELKNLLLHTAGRLTSRSGFEAWYRKDHSLSEVKFIGEFTFSDLESYRQGIPLQYKVTRGDPLLDVNQVQLGFFSQNDIRVTNRFTLFMGMRYEAQTNLRDKFNVDPRLGFAYAIGSTTVIRGGTGIFRLRLPFEEMQTLRRLDGTRQYELQIDRPGYPDPFVSGNVRIVPPSSRRVASPVLEAPYYISSSISVERSLPANLFVSISADYNRGVKLLRWRDINSPPPETGQRPFPNEGPLIQRDSRGSAKHTNVKINIRQRFSIFNITGAYTYYSGFNDEPNPQSTVLSNNYDMWSDWGHGTNPTHTFTTSVNSRLPLDVYLTTKLTARSGNYYNITTGKDDNGDGFIIDRPQGVAKNSEVGPGFFDVGFNFSKAFPLSHVPVTEGSRSARDSNSGPQINIFANVNNAFNMTHPGTPSGVMTSPFFGRSTSASSPREIEVGMRFQF
jgi:hypothetical protein